MLIGHLGQDPELRITQTGLSVANASLATTEKWTDKQGQKQEKTEWHRLVFWNKTADLVTKYCQKGSKLYIEGSLQTREWEDKEGNKRWITEIKVFSMQFLDTKAQNQGQAQQSGYQSNQDQPQNQTGQGQPNQEGQGQHSPAPADGFVEDDIPF